MPTHFRRYDERGDARFWTISCRRRLSFFHDDGLKRIVAEGFNVRARKALLQKLDCGHKNPLTRALVDRAEDWPWSSYRYYEFGDESVLRMGWDGSWPIIW